MEKSIHYKQPRLVNYLFKSDFYEIKNWTLNVDHGMSFGREFNDCLCMVHMQRGILTKQMYQLTSGNVTLERPNFEYQLLTSLGSCTIINFTDNFYAHLQDELRINNLFKKQGKDLLAIQTMASPESEVVLHAILNSIRHKERVQLDGLVLDFLNEFIKTTSTAPVIHKSSNRIHQEAVENAKEFLHSNFHRPISLVELSRHCGISLFYLSRLFKSHTNYSPHRYLSNIRLKRGEMLLREGSHSIVDIAYNSGFTSPEYFSTLFRLKYNQSPSSYRLKKR